MAGIGMGEIALEFCIKNILDKYVFAVPILLCLAVFMFKDFISCLTFNLGQR